MKLFYEEIKEKKKGLSGVHAKTGKRGYVGKLYTTDDFLKGKAKREYRGTTKIRSWNMYNKILHKDEFRKLPEEEQRKLLTHWRNVHKSKEILEEMQLGSQALYNILDKLGIEYSKRNRTKKSPKEQKPQIVEKKLEYVSTGEMIDSLSQYGGKAETKQGMKVEYCEEEMRIKAVGTGQTLKLDRMFLNLEWKILPNIVSFDEAKKAYQEGKAIKVVWNNLEQLYQKDKKGVHPSTPINWNFILEGEWTIEKSV